MPNVTAKLSGVYANVAPGTATLETVRPYVEQVIETFGPDRCLWGSDWPVVNIRGGDLPAWIAAFRAILAGYSDDEQAAMAHGTAERVYRVRLPAAGSERSAPLTMVADAVSGQGVYSCISIT